MCFVWFSLGFVFGGLDFSRRDLMAVNIQRGRDHGLPDYNTARKEFGLEPAESWADLSPNCNNETLIDGRKCDDTDFEVDDPCRVSHINFL